MGGIVAPGSRVTFPHHHTHSLAHSTRRCRLRGVPYTVMPPKQVKSIRMRDEPFFWLTWSANGKWVDSSTGDIIDAATRSVIAQLKDETGREVQGEKAVEVLFNLDGRVSKTVDQFGV